MVVIPVGGKDEDDGDDVAAPLSVGGRPKSSSGPKASSTALHYGTKPGHFETSKIHFPTSEGVSEVSGRANE